MTPTDAVDAVVIGAGVNGLVAANLLADAGWSVEVHEAQDEVGGACRSGEVTAPGFVSDLFSAFYPFGAASPILQSLELQEFGLRWEHAPHVLAHPTFGGPTAVLSRDLTQTQESLEQFRPGNGAAWGGLADQWEALAPHILPAAMSPFPPVRPMVRLARELGVDGLLRFGRFAVLPVARFAEETFGGDGGGAGLLLAGNALHTDLAPDSAVSGVYGWLLAMLGQQVGFPVVAGGAGRLTRALADRARARGAVVHLGSPIAGVVVSGGRARGVRRVDGAVIPARRAVLADVDAVSLYRSLVDAEALPARLLEDLDRFQWDNATVKLDWALSGPVPWRDPACAGAGTVHLGGSMDELRIYAGSLARRLLPERPFLIFGQMTTSDPSRSPAGTESAWAYTHVPQSPEGDAGEGVPLPWGPASVRAFVERMEAEVERWAPGFRELILARHVQAPEDLQRADGALHNGALNGGTASLHQLAIFRPVPGLGRPETPVEGLYLASMSAHPGGGVHGGPGANAARAAMADEGWQGRVRRPALRALQRRIYRPAR